MSTTPVPTPAGDDNPWQNLKPRDIFTDPGFYKMSKEARRIVASKVWKDFASATPADQDATLDAPQTYWEEYFKPEPVKEPGFLEKAKNVLGKAMGYVGEAELESGKAHLAAGEEMNKKLAQGVQKVKDLFTPLPANFGPPPSIEQLQKEAAEARRPKPKLPSMFENKEATYIGMSVPEEPLKPGMTINVGDLKKLPVIGHDKNGNLTIPVPGEEEEKPKPTGDPMKQTVTLPSEMTMPNFDNVDFVEDEWGKLQIVPKKKPKREIVFLDGQPYMRIEKEQPPPVTEESIRKQNIWRMRHNMPIIPIAPDRFGNAIMATMNGFASGLPATIKSVAAFKHMWDMAWQPMGISEEDWNKGKFPPMPKLEDSWIWKAGQDIQNKINEGVPINPSFQNEFWATMVPQGLGSTAFFATVGALGGELGLPAAAVTAGAGAMTQMGPMYEQAYFSGATREQLFATAIAGMGLGATEAIPINRALERFDKVSGGFVTKFIKDRLISGTLKGGISGFAEEFSQEFLQDLGQDWVMSSVDPNNKMDTKNDLKQGLAGGVSGAAFSALMSALGVSNMRLHMRDTFANRRDQIKANLERAGVPAEEIKTRMGILKAQEKQFIRRLEQEMEAQQKTADRKLEEHKKLTGTEAVMILKPESGAVIAIQSKEDYDRAKRAEADTLSGIPTEEIDRMMQGRKKLPPDLDKSRGLPQTFTMPKEGAGETVPVTVSAKPTIAPVTPEQLTQLNQEIGEFAQGQRQAVMIPQGVDPIDRKAAISNAGPGSRVFWTMQGPIIYNPAKINPEAIQQMLLNGRQDELTARTELPTAPVTPAPESTPETVPQPEGAATPVTPEAAPATAAPLAPQQTPQAPVEPQAPQGPRTVNAEPVGNAIQDSWLISTPEGGRLEVRFTDTSAYIEQVRVPPEVQRQGIATAMYEKLGEMMKQRGIPGTNIEANTQGDPEILAKLRARAAAIAGEGNPDIGRYDISMAEEELPPEMGAAPFIPEAMGKPWEQQEEYEEASNDLREVNQRLGLGDPDEEGSVSTEESGEATDIDEGGDENPEPEDGEEDEYSSETSDHFFDVVTPYKEIGVPGSGSVVHTATSQEEAQEDVEAREPKKVIKELPELPKEAEYGPEFLYTQALDQTTIDALDNGQVTQDLIDNLKNKANRRLAKIQRVSKMANDAGWEISDGITLLQLYRSEQNGAPIIQAWDALSYGRIQIPELLWLVKEVTGKDMGLNKRLRTALGHFVPNGVGGLIEVRPDLAYELKDREQLTRTIAHEIGHAIDFAPDSDIAKGNLIGRLLSLHKFLKQTYDLNGTKLREKTLRAELTALSDYWRPWDQANAPKWFRDYRASAVELYADFLSAILNSPGTAARLAPTAYKVWHQEIDRKPDVKDSYIKLRLMMQGTPEQLLDHRMERMAAMFNTAESIEMELALGENTRSYSWWGGIRDQFDDRRWEIKQRVRKAQRAGAYAPVEDANPLYLWDELPSKLRTDNYRYQKKVLDLCVEPLKAKGMSFREINEYMFLHRAATERKNMFNPIIGLGEYAYQSLEHMKKVLGDERFALVEKAAKTYHDLRWDLIEAAQASGIYSKDLVEKVFEPSKYTYAKFTPVEYIKEWVSAHVQKQTGFTGNIAGPFTETLKMDQSLMYLTTRNNAVKATLDFIRQYYPDEIRPAIRKDRGPMVGAPQFHDAPTGYDLVEVMEDGKPAGYYVDQHIADSCNNISPERVDKISWVAQQYSRKYFWPIAILYNFGFGGWGNPNRDFWSNFRKLPLKGAVVGDLIQLMGAYAKSAPHVFRWMWKDKNSDALVNEMIDSYSFSMPLSDLVADEEDPYMLILKRAGIIKDTGAINRPMAAKLFYGGLHLIGAPMRFLMQFTEMTGKLAGFQVRKEAGEIGKELAYNMRNFTSTPNYDVKGSKQNTTNAWFVFSTIMKEGWKSEYLVATDPKTRSGYWLRTSKLLVLKTLQVLAELGLLNAIFGDDLEKKYKAATRYMKNNYLLIPASEPDEAGRVSFIPMPCDEMTRMLGTILRHTLIAMKGNDPENFDDFVKSFLANAMPSLTPAVTTVVGWGDFLSGVNFLDGFRQTPVFSDSVQKARTLERWKRMVYWTLNENGLGQFATFDDSKQSWYQMWTQVDPTVGRLMGRMLKQTNYGLVESEKADLSMIERERERQNLAKKHATSTVKRFYDEKYQIDRQNTLTKGFAARGGDAKQLTQQYPEGIWASLYDKSASALSLLQKKIAAIEADPKLSEKDKALQVILIHKQMDEIARKALVSSGKIKEEKSEELPRDFGNPPVIE